MASVLKTSDSHPMVIDQLVVSPTDGRIGMTLCPGKYHPNAAGGAWKRDLDIDLRAIVDAGATALISLLEFSEYVSLRVKQLPDKSRELGLEHYSLAITDGGVPDAAFETLWADIGQRLRDKLVNGELVVLHCKGGLGRTGLLAARLCVEFGANPDSAIQRVREVRPGTIETKEQEQYIYRLNLL